MIGKDEATLENRKAIIKRTSSFGVRFEPRRERSNPLGFRMTSLSLEGSRK